MKKIKFHSVQNSLVICLFLLGMFVSCSNQTDMNIAKTDLEKRGLKGNIKSLVETEFLYAEETGEIRKTNMLRKSVSNYNEAGYLLSKEVHDSEGNMIGEETCKYNEKNELIELRNFNVFPSGINEILKSFEYDENGNETQCIDYNADGSISTRSTKIYDNSLLVEQSSYWDGGSLLVKSTFKYNKRGNMIEEMVFDSNGNLEYKYVSEYDRHGNNTANYRYDSGGNLVIKSTSEYSAQNKLTRKISCNPDGHIISEMTLIYDDNGNTIEKKLLDKENKISSRELTVYNTEGNVIEKTTYSEEEFVGSVKYSNQDSMGNLLRITFISPESSSVIEREIVFH